jgi:hypothetical protein
MSAAAAATTMINVRLVMDGFEVNKYDPCSVGDRLSASG